MHHALRFARRSGRVEELHDVIGGRPTRLETFRCILIRISLKVEQDLLEALRPFATDDEEMAQARQFRTNTACHRRIVKAAKLVRYHEHLALCQAEHEFQLALTE